MPKIAKLVLILVLSMSLTTACSKSAKAPKLPDLSEHSGNFSTSANITYKDFSASASIIQETPQACSVVFTSPESLKDMSMVFWQDHVDLSYKGASFTFSPQSVPGGAVANIAVSTINSAMKDNGLTVDYTDDILTLSGMMSSGEFVLKLDRENGNLLKLVVPEEELEIEFVNFTFLD